MKIAHVSTWNFNNIEDYCGSQYFVARQFTHLGLEQQLIHLHNKRLDFLPVSYTHLTLPTIHSV